MTAKKKLLLIMFVILMVLNGSGIAIYYFHIAPEEPIESSGESIVEENQETEEAPVTLSDDYYSLHFNYGDAVEVCMIEARSRNSNLIQLSVNDRSSRYKEKENMYLIKLESHVGTPMNYDEKEHSCDIDPKVQGVAFYKEVVRRTVIRPGN